LLLPTQQAVDKLIFSVIPALGRNPQVSLTYRFSWIPAFAGMTKEHESPSEITLSTGCQAVQAVQAIQTVFSFAERGVDGGVDRDVPPKPSYPS
jgi:hypothetical protein